MDQQIPYYPQNMHGFCFDYHHCSYDRHYCHYTSMKMSTYDTSFHHVFKQCQSKWEGVHGIIYMTILLLAICRSSASWYFKALDLWCIMWYVSKPQPTHIQCTKPASTWIKSCNLFPHGGVTFLTNFAANVAVMWCKYGWHFYQEIAVSLKWFGQESYIDVEPNPEFMAMYVHAWCNILGL